MEQAGSIDRNNDFMIFRASWNIYHNDLPESWYVQREEIKPKLHYICWSGRNNNLYSRNIVAFQDMIGRYLRNHLSRFALISGSPGNGLEAGFEELPNLGSEDCCVIFFSGEAIQDKKGNIRPSLENGNEAFWQTFEKYSTESEGHIFLIIDSHKTEIMDYEIKPLQFSFAKKLVVLQSYSNNGLHNYFFNLFLNTVKQTGGNIRYSDLITRLNLRYHHDNRKYFPTAYAYQAETMKTWLFSGIIPYKKSEMVYYDDSVNSWVIKMGIQDGVTPSLEFMNTLIKLEDSRIYRLNQVEQNYSVVDGFEEEDKENIFNAEFLQTALPKIKIGFDKNLNQEMKDFFVRTAGSFGLYFVDLIDNPNEAAFLIKNKENKYFLARQTDEVEELDRPMFFYQTDIYEFIKQIEYIAQWNAVIDLDNPQNKIPSEDYKIVIECFEGQKVTMTNMNEVFGHIQTDPENIELKYRNGVSPYFKCHLEMKNTNDPNKHYYVNFLYMDSTYGINNFNASNNSFLTKDEKVALNVKGNGFIRAFIEEEYIKNETLEIQDFLLIFISKDSIELNPLTQDYLKFETETSRSLSFEERTFKQTFLLPQTDWTVKKIPIRILYDDRTFEQTIEQTIKERKILVPNDLQKNRWGRRSVNNDFVLSAEVKEKTLISLVGFYEVILEVHHLTRKIPDNNKVAILLHDSFADSVHFLKFKNGKAYIKVPAYEDFTAAAILYDGTELELDLSEISGLPKKFYAYQPKKSFKNTIDRLLKENRVYVSDDPHKSRWGGSMIINNWLLSAEVKAEKDSYNIVLSLENNELKNENKEVAFLLHDSFTEKPIMFARTLEGVARCRFKTHKAFTVGVYIEDGTKLELDLAQEDVFKITTPFITSDSNELELDLVQEKELPLKKHAYQPTEPFKNKVEKLLKSKIKIPDDLQKNRWGGRSEVNNWYLSAIVKKEEYSHRVILTVENDDQTIQNKEVAFLLHDSFGDKQTMFAKTEEGSTRCSFKSYEAFTVGVYIEGGTKLELDLNKQEGFPPSFYY